MGDCQLDDLLDMLDDDEDVFREEEIDNPEPQNNGDDNDDEDEEMKQLREMEEKVRLMKEKMSRKKLESENPKASSSSSSAQTTPKQDKSLPSSKQSKQSGGPVTPSREFDMFSSSSSGEVSRSLVSPVKTNPLKEAEREKRPVQLVTKTPQWCPGKMQTSSTRVLQGAEAEAVRVAINKDRGESEMRRIARADLADSDDEDLSPFGLEIKRGVKARTGAGLQERELQSLARGGMVRPADSLVPKVEKRLEGKNVLTERNSRIRITNPQISQAKFDSMISGRRFHPMHSLIKSPTSQDDWVTMGVLYHKMPPKTSSGGKDFSVWKLTDLRGNCLSVTLFLFGRAHKDHWKMPLHKVVGILNPKAMEEKSKPKSTNKEGITISIDHPDKLLELGDSADIAKCAHKKNDGSSCTQIVNRAECEYCVFHIKQAYKASSSQRQSLQSSFSGGPAVNKQRKNSKEGGFVEGKFNNFTPVVGRKSAASKARDNRLLAGLGGGVSDTGKDIKSVMTSGRDSKGRPRGGILNDEQKQAVKAVSENVSEELGARLLAPTPGARALLGTMVKVDKDKVKQSKPEVAMSAKELLEQHKNFVTPVLGRGVGKEEEICLDLAPNAKAKYAEAGHAKAIAILAMRKKGITKVDPNMTHSAKGRERDIKEKVKKRIREEDIDETENDNHTSKKSKAEPKTVMIFGKEVSVDKLEEIRNKKSANTHLVDEADLEAADKYFDKAEKKDAMEEKMLSTTSIQVKAVTCYICDYTSYKASELCREKGHRVKVIDAKKRFFKCGDCSTRTVSLNRLPKESCKKCGSSRWEKAGMIAERKGPLLESEQLSVRGNEEMFIGSVTGRAQLNV